MLSVLPTPCLLSLVALAHLGAENPTVGFELERFVDRTVAPEAIEPEIYGPPPQPGLSTFVLELEPGALAGPAQEPAPAAGDAEASDLAKKLSNPVADLISVPFQSNFNWGAGPNDDGFNYTLNIQPVIPFSMNEDWNIISRTILPVIYQTDIIPDEDEFGLGDTTQSFFFSPKVSDPIWGVGPVFLIPTATEDALGTGKWGIGPTGVILKQSGPWTVGMLANQIWSFAGESNRPDVNSTFLQPFVSYTTAHATSFTVNTESTYDWENEEWSVPLNFMISQVLKIAGRPISFQIGYRYYADTPPGGPDWGLRFNIVLLYPTK